LNSRSYLEPKKKAKEKESYISMKMKTCKSLSSRFKKNFIDLSITKRMISYFLKYIMVKNKLKKEKLMSMYNIILVMFCSSS
jgi:hypothetical protein